MAHFLIFVVATALIHLATAQCPAVTTCLKQDDLCPVLPVPRTSFPAPVSPDDGFSLTEIRPGVYSFFDGTYRTLILYSGRRLTAVDFPESTFRDGQYLVTIAAKTILNAEIPTRIDMVYSHRHLDHIGGAGSFLADMRREFPGAQVFVWGTKVTQNFLASLERSTIPNVTVFVSEKRTVNIADGLNLELINAGDGHTEDDLAAYIRPSANNPGLVHLVDYLTPGFAPFFRFSVTPDVSALIQAQEKVLKLDWEVYSGGHGKLGRKNDLRTNIQYTMDTLRFNREAAAEVTTEQLLEAGVGRVNDPSAVEFGNGGWAFVTAANVQGEICTRKLISKYGCTLGSVAVFAPSHCNVAFFYELVAV